MIEVLLVASIAASSPTVPLTPPPTPKPIYTPPPTPKPTYTPPPRESWSDKMWRRYKDGSR